MLFGAEIAFAYQNLDLYVREVRGERAGPREREAVGLRIALEIARSFRDGGRPWREDGLSETLQVPVRTMRSVLARLDEARVVSGIADAESPGGWQLGRPAEAIRVTDVLDALRGDREPAHGDAVLARVVDERLAELGEGERKAANGATLADLLSELPPRSTD